MTRPRSLARGETTRNQPTFRLIRGLLLFEASLYAAVTPVLPHYAHVLGASKPAIGVLAASYSAGVIPGSLLGGWAASRAGVRRTTLFGLLAFAVAVAAFGFATDLVALDALRAVQGVACGFIWGGALTWALALAPPERRGAMIGSVIGAAIFGTLLGPLLGVFAVSVGTGPVFAAVGAISIALAICVQRHPEPTASAALPAAGLFSGSAPPRGRRSSEAGAGRRGLWLGAWLILLEATTIGAISALLPLRLSHLGASGVAIGATFVLASGLSAALAPIVGRTTDRRGPRLPMAVGLITSAALFVALPIPHPWLAVAAISVILLGGPLTAFMIPAVSLMTVSAERAGIAVVLATTLVNLAYAVGETAGAPFAAVLSSATSDAVPLLVLAVLMVLTLRLVFTASRDEPAPADPKRDPKPDPGPDLDSDPTLTTAPESKVRALVPAP